MRFQQAPYRIADVVALLFIAHGNTSFGSLAPIIPYRSCKHYLDGTPQARCISAIHYTSDALYIFTVRGKEFCRELLHDGQVQILAYTRYKEMIRVSAKAVPVPEAEQKRCIDLIFQE